MENRNRYEENEWLSKNRKSKRRITIRKLLTKKKEQKWT